MRSLPDQKTDLHRLQLRLGLKVTEELEEARSAKIPGQRPIFRYLIDQIKKGNADAILCWHLNRLIRNSLEAGEVAYLLQTGVIQCIQTMERQFLPKDSALIFAFEAGMATQYSIDLSVNVTRGNREKVARGWYANQPPHGYRTNLLTGESEPHPDEYPLIRRAWELLLSGSANGPQILAALNSWGYARVTRKGGRRPMTRSSLDRMFKNRFYYGPFPYKGVWHQGRHQPMLTEAEFDRAGRLLGRPDPYRTHRLQLAFTGLIRCGTCGCLITAERRVKRYVTTQREVSYTYYHCTGAKGCPKESVSEDFLESEIRPYVETCQINQALRDWIESVLARDQNLQLPVSSVVKAEQEKTRKSLNNRIDALFEMRAGGEISAEEFTTRKRRLQNQLFELDSTANHQVERWNRNVMAVRRAADFAVDVFDRFTSGSPTEKRQITGLIADSYFLTLGKLEIRPNPVFDVLRTFEPPKGRPNMVQAGAEVALNPMERKWWDRIRTLLSDSDLRFEDETVY